MTTDEVCVEVIRLGLIVVDPEQGVAVATRFHGREIGCTNTKGYRVATIHLGPIRKQVKVHRLVWIAANGVPPAGTVIDHVNRVKDDNRLANLRVVKDRENARNRRTYVGTENPAAKINADIAASIRRAHVEIGSARKVARAYGVSASLVHQIIRGERWL